MQCSGCVQAFRAHAYADVHTRMHKYAHARMRRFLHTSACNPRMYGVTNGVVVLALTASSSAPFFFLPLLRAFSPSRDCWSRPAPFHAGVSFSLVEASPGGDGREASGARARARARAQPTKALKKRTWDWSSGSWRSAFPRVLALESSGPSIFRIFFYRGLHHSRCLLILLSIVAAAVFCYLATVAFHVSEGQIKIFEAPCARDRS